MYVSGVCTWDHILFSQMNIYPSPTSKQPDNVLLTRVMKYAQLCMRASISSVGASASVAFSICLAESNASNLVM